MTTDQLRDLLVVSRLSTEMQQDDIQEAGTSSVGQLQEFIKVSF